MSNAAREAGVVPRRIHLVVAIDRLLVRLLQAAPGQWVVKGGYANQLRRPDDARFTEDLDLKIDAAIETAPELLASGFAVDLGDDFSYDVASSPAPLEGPPGGGLRFVVVARLAGTELVRFKVDVSAADVVVGDFESYFSDPVLERLGFRRSRFPVYPVNQHFAEKLHALTLPRGTPELVTSSTLSGSSTTSRSDPTRWRSHASRPSSGGRPMRGHPSSTCRLTRGLDRTACGGLSWIWLSRPRPRRRRPCDPSSSRSISAPPTGHGIQQYRNGVSRAPRNEPGRWPTLCRR
jgi:hypothetical protein